MSRHFISVNSFSILYFLYLTHQVQPSTSTVVETVIGLTSGLWSLYEYTKMYIAEDPVAQDVANLKLQSISMEGTISVMHSDISKIRKNIGFDRQMEKLASAVKKIEVMFYDYTIYKKNFTKSRNKNHFANSTYEDFVHRVFRGDVYGISEKLDEISGIVALDAEQVDIPVIDTLATNSKEFSNYCKTKLSQMQLFRKLLGHLTVIETKGLMTLLFSYDLKEWLTQANFADDRILEQKKIYARYNRMVRKFKKFIAPLSNEIHACEPGKHVYGKTYVELENLFQTVLRNELDTVMPNECEGSCKQIENHIPHCQFTSNDGESGLHTLCKETHTCSTPLRECRPFSKHNAALIQETPYVCISTKPYGPRRYDYVSFNETDSRRCKSKKIIEIKDKHLSVPRLPVNCIYCQCSCVTGNRRANKFKLIDYRISMLNVLSYYELGYVMIGARFVMRNNVIHILIRQGKLLPHGIIDPNTIHWMNFPERDIETKEIKWGAHTFNLDDIMVPEGHAVVGVSITTSDVYESQHFILQVMHMPFNFTNGSISNSSKPQVINPGFVAQREVDLNNKDVPTRSFDNIFYSKDGQYVRFQPSGLEADGGQTTIPFIDTQIVQPDITTPLSGVGLFHRGSSKSGGFLGLKLFTYNFTSLLREDHVIDEHLIKSLM